MCPPPQTSRHERLLPADGTGLPVEPNENFGTFPFGQPIGKYLSACQGYSILAETAKAANLEPHGGVKGQWALRAARQAAALPRQGLQIVISKSPRYRGKIPERSVLAIRRRCEKAFALKNPAALSAGFLFREARFVGTRALRT